MPRTFQEFVHWLDQGGGARVLGRAAVALAVVMLSLLVAWKQFRGPQSESTLIQADLGRQIARGEGFTTLVNFPQTAAWLAARGVRFDPEKAYPELHYAPLYALVVAGALAALPESWEHALFASAPAPPDGFGGDYLLLVVNVILLWIAAWQTLALGSRLFSPRAGVLASLALLLSVAVWRQTVAVNGTPLLMVLVLAAFQLWLRLERESGDASPIGAADPNADHSRAEDSPAEGQGGAGRRSWPSWLALGAVCGALFLAEYSAGILLGVALAYAWLTRAGARRWLAIALLWAGALLVAAPWLVRNVRLTGHPMALASHQLALRSGDPTAEPSAYRATLATKVPELSLPKLGNKTLTGLQEAVQSGLWTGGGLFLTAFFVASWLYGYRSPLARRMRWTFVAAFAACILARSLFHSGEGERQPAVWLAPLIMVFGAGFFFVLVDSSRAVSAWPRLAAVVLLGAQALPLLHDVLEPRRLHFQYPPYYPSLFIGLRQELERRVVPGRYGVMADVPAGVAWYGGLRAWAQPPQLRDFYAIMAEQPIAELLLTPRTLDRPFFSELSGKPQLPAALQVDASRLGEWGRIYSGLFTGRLPPEFPLRSTTRIADNLYVLLDPGLPPLR